MAEYKGVLLNRLLTLILIILIPIYFFTLMWYVNIQTPFTFTFFEFYFPGSSAIITTIVTPILFTVPWWIFLIMYRNKFANSFTELRERFFIIPKRWIIFYGMNGLLVISLLFVPFVTPSFIIIVFGLLAHDIYLLTLSEREGKGKYIAFIIILILVEIFPLIIQIEFMNKYMLFWQNIFLIWDTFLPYIYTFTVLVANALAFGSIIWLVYGGAAEFERESGMTVTTEAPIVKIRTFQLLIFSSFLFIWIWSLLYPHLIILSQIIAIIDIVALTVAIIVMLISFRKNIQLETSTSPVIGYGFMLVFMVLEIVQMFPFLLGAQVSADHLLLMTIVVFIAGIMFLIMWFISFLVAEKEDDY